MTDYGTLYRRAAITGWTVTGVSLLGILAIGLLAGFGVLPDEPPRWARVLVAILFGTAGAGIKAAYTSREKITEQRYREELEDAREAAWQAGNRAGYEDGYAGWKADQ